MNEESKLESRISSQIAEHKRSLDRLVVKPGADLREISRKLTREVNQRRRTEKRLRESEKRFRTLFACAPDAIYLANLDGYFIDGNLAAEKLTGYDRNEVIGKNFVELNLLSPEDADRAAAILTRNKNGSPTGPDEFSLTRKNGSIVVVEIRTHPVRILGKDVTLGIARDITERKRLDEERKTLEVNFRHQQKLESLGLLAGGVAHEINNPINGIMNYAQLLADNPADAASTAEYAGEILCESERVIAIVRNLLAFARQGKSELCPCRMSDMVEGTVGLIRSILRNEQILLHVDVPEDLPLIICRCQQIRQVLMNLLMNARDALNAKFNGSHPEKTLILHAYTFEHDGRPWLRTSIADQGTGIPEDIRERIFDPFFTNKEQGKGTGLGLSTSHGIVRDHRGFLTVESEPGEYTCFHLDLPIEGGGGEMFSDWPDHKEFDHDSCFEWCRL